MASVKAAYSDDLASLFLIFRVGVKTGVEHSRFGVDGLQWSFDIKAGGGWWGVGCGGSLCPNHWYLQRFFASLRARNILRRDVKQHALSKASMPLANMPKALSLRPRLVP